jgi:hypothetical protein
VGSSVTTRIGGSCISGFRASAQAWHGDDRIFQTRWMFHHELKCSKVSSLLTFHPSINLRVALSIVNKQNLSCLSWTMSPIWKVFQVGKGIAKSTSLTRHSKACSKARYLHCTSSKLYAVYAQELSFSVLIWTRNQFRIQVHLYCKGATYKSRG